MSALAAPPGQAAQSAGSGVSSIQETTLDLLWIAHDVACFAGLGKSLLYRAVLAVAGPPEAFAGSDHADRALAGYAAFLNSLQCTVQFLVHAEDVDAGAYAQRWEARVRQLPPALARLAREHAVWARQELGKLGLLKRRLYLVVGADTAMSPIRSLAGATRWVGTGLRRRWGRGMPRPSDATQAIAVLAERCDRLQKMLKDAGVRASRLGDVALARLYRACWGHANAGEQRFDRDVQAFFVAAGSA